jgi:F420-0:gamma-glutamyl ligase
MQSGLTVVGVKNMGFLIDDTRTESKDGERGVTTSWVGMFAERHWRNSPEAANDGMVM